MRTLPAGFIAPCLPTKTEKLPSGSQWLHEIKHDGFRIIARKSGGRVRLYSRPGNNFTRRFPHSAIVVKDLQSSEVTAVSTSPNAEKAFLNDDAKSLLCTVLETPICSSTRTLAPIPG